MKLKTIIRLWPYYFGLVILAAMLTLMMSFAGCVSRQSDLCNCVVDSVWAVPQASVAEPFQIYHFHTDCGVTTTSLSKEHKNGDTIKFIKR
jgi:hypothetical protein